MEKSTMAADGASGAAAGLAWKLGLIQKLLALVGVGAVGAVVMASFDPPPTRRAMFAQALAAGVMAILFTPAMVRWLDSMFDWITVNDVESWAEVALPCGFMVGALSWGFIGALSKLRTIVKDKGADALARRAGIE
jgi:hypothetical protein